MKIMMFEKTRHQNIDIWPNARLFMTMTKLEDEILKTQNIDKGRPWENFMNFVSKYIFYINVYFQEAKYSFATI